MPRREICPRKGTLELLVARDIRSNWDDRRIYDGITRIVQAYRRDRSLFQKFAVIFEGPVDLDEETFEYFLGHVRKASPIRIRGSASRTMRVLAAILRTPAFSVQFWRRSFLYRWIAPSRQPAGTPFRMSGAGVQSSRSVRATAGAGTVRTNAH